MRALQCQLRKLSGLCIEHTPRWNVKKSTSMSLDQLSLNQYQYLSVLGALVQKPMATKTATMMMKLDEGVAGGAASCR